MIYVGIDIASENHDFFIMNSNGEPYTTRSVTIPNTSEGYKKLHKSIQDFCGASNDYQVRIGLESTGFYHRNILTFLLEKEYSVMVINPILTNMYKKSIKVHIAKNDNLDSMYICKFLQSPDTVFTPYTFISYHSEALKSLSRERFSLVEELRLAKINIYKLVSQIFPEYLKLFTNIYQGSALAILDKYNNPEKISRSHTNSLSSMIHGRCTTTAVDIVTAAKNSVGIKSEHLYFHLKQAINRLKNISDEIEEYNQQIKYYVDLISSNILTIPGISYITAGLILGEIGDIARFKNADHLVSFAGLDVIVYESGKYKAKNLSISKKGSKYLRYALYQAAKSCWIHDPMFNKYYLKKKAENKHYYVILGHLEKKLIKVIYSILKDKEKTYSPQI